uniref:Uncharacterized protein n=1 Tax=Siphoviridae sp. ctB3v5 TaxID=2826186 RepID=A0A8S5M8L2_9CAUD|nr:MAG TPA: hypothetical protein [Siphoviridae sp. ctB3v5]
MFKLLSRVYIMLLQKMMLWKCAGFLIYFIN